MKNNRTYLSLAGLLFVVVLVTMLWQYPRVHVRLHNQGTLTMFDYRAENEKMRVENYFSQATPYSGGATITFTDPANVPAALSCQVVYADGTVTHQLTARGEGVYVLDVVDQKRTGQVPLEIQILNSDDQTIYSTAAFVSGDNYLYQAHSPDFAYYNIYANEQGIFMGHFSAYDATNLVSQYDSVMVEFCQIDGSKSDGYRLLARQGYGVRDFVNMDVNTWLNFLEEAEYDASMPIEVVMTFQGSTQYTIAMTLTEGVA